MQMTDFLSRLKGVKRNGSNGWLALCPGHNDHNQSLSIKEADGKILIHCHAGCQTEAVVERMGLTMNDLFLDGHKAKLEQREIEAIYHYMDSNGKPFEVVRTRPKGFYQRQPDGKGGYINNLKGIIPTLYHEDELMPAIDSDTPIHFVEGEKDTDRLRSLGLVATTNPGGAGKWQSRYSEALKGADLVIIPDNDTPGHAHALKVARSCYGIAKRVRVLELPGESKDVSDWLDNGGDIEQLKRLADACPDFEPSDNGVKLRRMADVKAEAVSWLWRPYIPKRKLTLLEGDPGIGKSWLSLAIATAVSLGKGLPEQEPTEPANVVIASAEDGLGDTIRPRLDAMGADVGRIFAIDGALTLDESGFALLEGYLQRQRPALLVIDPLVAYLGAGVDIFRANETRAVMAQLARLAEQFSVAILAVRHLTKGGQLKAIYRGLGSIDFTAACRSVLLAGCDAENQQNRALVHIKSNLALAGPAIGYELREGGFYWTGESTLTATQILAADSDARTSELDEAVAFLKDELGDGAVPAKDVYREAEGIGISKRTLERAKAQAGIKARRQGEKGKRGSGAWVWELPADLDRQDIPSKGESQSQNDLHRQHRHIEKFGDLNQTEAKKEVAAESLGDLNHEAPGLPCVKGPGTCDLRTDASKPFSCAFTPEDCPRRHP